MHSYLPLALAMMITANLGCQRYGPLNRYGKRAETRRNARLKSPARLANEVTAERGIVPAKKDEI